MKKRKLIVLVVSDLDPASDAIAQDIRDAFERDFGIPDNRLDVYKVALTIKQINEIALEPSMAAKSTSPTYDAFVERYGITDAYELEALEPADLRRLLEDIIESVHGYGRLRRGDRAGAQGRRSHQGHEGRRGSFLQRLAGAE